MLMIRGIDVFGRQAISPLEKKIIDSANISAKTLFENRGAAHLKEQWGKPVDEVTIDDVEQSVIQVVQKTLPKVREKYGTTTIREGTVG